MQDGLDAEQLLRARQEGRESVDLVVPVSPSQAATMGRFVELLDFADDFCRQQQLLGLARTPPQVRFQTWFFTEFARQGSRPQRPPLGGGRHPGVTPQA